MPFTSLYFLLPPAHHVFFEKQSCSVNPPRAVDLLPFPGTRALLELRISLSIWCWEWKILSCLHLIAISWMDTCSEKAEQTRGTVEFEEFGSSFVVKRASALLKGWVWVLVPPFTAQLGKLGTVLHIPQNVYQGVVFGLLASESSGLLGHLGGSVR